MRSDPQARGRGGTLRRIALWLPGLAGLTLLAVLVWIAWVYSGVRATAQAPEGTLALAGLQGPVRVDRDARGIPHIRARNERDAFFAQGFVEGNDRLFQLDIYRRLVSGRLAEIFGPSLLAVDEQSRVFDVQGTVAAEERGLGPKERDELAAFAQGVQAAIDTRPLPPEFRILGYHPEPWGSRDALRVAFATVIALADSWDEIVTRDDVDRAGPPGILNALYPITDPRYDVPIDGTRRAPVAPLPPLEVRAQPALQTGALDLPEHPEVGSNDFAAGAALTQTGRALLANDPHLQLRIPGVWYLVDMAAPGFHVSGATLAGVPGVILGHNEHLAWGVTNGTVATTRVYRERFRDATSDEYLADGTWLHAMHRHETFSVRFGATQTRDYLATRHGFVFERRGAIGFAAAWTAVSDTRSGLTTYAALGHAGGVRAALRALAGYPGPPQNFVLADDRGNAAYALAGDVWRDPVWARHALDGPASPATRPQYLPFSALPKVAPSRRSLVFTANDRVYGAGYPYRLTAFFEAPYRAARIAELLHGTRRHDVASFSAIQADALSLSERDLARAAGAAIGRRAPSDAELRQAGTVLADFDGLFTGESHAAVYAWALRRAASARLVRYHLDGPLARRYLSENTGIALVAVSRMLRERPHGWVPGDDFDGFLVEATRDALADLKKAHQLDATWAEVGGRTALHPLNGFGITMWNGVPFPGYGDGFTPHAQAPGVTQSFRAVWDVGRWDEGGIMIPQGESGAPGSPHYRDGAAAWLAGELIPLPFDDAAVARERSSTLTLTP